MATSTSQETESMAPPTTAENSPWTRPTDEIAPPGYYPRTRSGATPTPTGTASGGARWLRPISPPASDRTLSTGFKHHPVKTGWNLFGATLQLVVGIGLLTLGIVVIYAVIATGGGTHP
jgi:hypothetical protein